jgi:ADP-L-glycero-D-manno-heptose 6-epimerase
MKSLTAWEGADKGGRMLVITGAAGFIGSNLVRALNDRGRADLLLVDTLVNGANLQGCAFQDFLDKDTFEKLIASRQLRIQPDAIFHQGACADTLEQDELFLFHNNFDFSKILLEYAVEEHIPFIYASSAAVYGNNSDFLESLSNEMPLNGYARSKLAMDNFARNILPLARSTVVGLRYFNVYGPHEKHKGRMASVIYQFYRQLEETSTANLFEGSDGFSAGEQQRDFIFVDDVIKVNLFFFEEANRGVFHKGVLNAGTGQSRSFNDAARILIRLLGKGRIRYIPFMPGLRERYQRRTQAVIHALRGCGFTEQFTTLEHGIVQSVDAWRAGR